MVVNLPREQFPAGAAAHEYKERWLWLGLHDQSARFDQVGHALAHLQVADVKHDTTVHWQIEHLPSYCWIDETEALRIDAVVLNVHGISRHANLNKPLLQWLADCKDR